MFEKEAEEYVMREDVITENDRVPFDNGYGFQTVSFEDEVKKGFQDGAEFGYNKANEWHDLRKDPNDLPDTDRNVWVKRESELECQIDNYYKDDKGWGIMFREGYCTDDVIAWCELPTFDKE